LMGLSFYEVLKFTLATAFMAGLINAAFSLLYFIRLWHKNILHTEELKREIMHTQLESIRHQLSPHFFFNSLNSLNLVIEENPAEAIKYVQHIAHMYRYLLQSKETKVVPLHHELKFAESYIYLQKMRFGKALDMSVIIDKPDMQTVIPPLTLYILLENALKHNIITKSRPLQINVFIRDGKLQISNNVQARSMPEEKPIIGLKTVRSSYESICVQPMQIIQDDDNFTVSLPLIKELSQSA
ncbi:MAG: sensor histidine kinase, partial [Bacteroidia bacterium]